MARASNNWKRGCRKHWKNIATPRSTEESEMRQRGTPFAASKIPAP
jgi:hypothetical protein